MPYCCTVFQPRDLKYEVNKPVFGNSLILQKPPNFGFLGNFQSSKNPRFFELMSSTNHWFWGFENVPHSKNLPNTGNKPIATNYVKRLPLHLHVQESQVSATSTTNEQNQC